MALLQYHQLAPGKRCCICDLLADLGCGGAAIHAAMPLAGLVGVVRVRQSPQPRESRVRDVTACMAHQANAYGIVRDVGFIGLLTRCRSGLTGTVATRYSH
jgi:hypothetical protein